MCGKRGMPLEKRLVTGNCMITDYAGLTAENCAEKEKGNG